MLEIYDGKFENDKYSGSGKAVFEKDLIVHTQLTNMAFESCLIFGLRFFIKFICLQVGLQLRY